MSVPVEKLLQKGLIWRGERTITEVETLSPGALHEWSLDLPLKGWLPPTLLVCALLHQLVEKEKLIFWIGKRCWPTASTLENCLPSSMQRCVFLNPGNKEKKLWTAIQALRTSFSTAVVCDAERFSSIATRRLLLAAKDTHSFVFLMRPPWEINSPSSAQTKWLATPLKNSNESPAWTLSLLRARGLAATKKWQMELLEDDEAFSLSVLPNLVDRSSLKTNRAA